MHHPWRELRAKEHVTVKWEYLPGDFHAVTDGETIWIDKRLLQVERRCAIAHEQVHIELGHSEPQHHKDEARVRTITAKRLIDTGDLIDTLKWAHTVEEAADELWVTPEVLQDRLRALSPAEKAMINHAVQTAWHQEH